MICASFILYGFVNELVQTVNNLAAALSVISYYKKL
jgi:hypothetical protein